MITRETRKMSSECHSMDVQHLTCLRVEVDFSLFARSFLRFLPSIEGQLVEGPARFRSSPGEPVNICREISIWRVNKEIFKRKFSMFVSNFDIYLKSETRIVGSSRIDPRW